MLYRRMSLIFESREKCHLWEGLMEKAISCTWEGFTFPSDIWSSIIRVRVQERKTKSVSVTATIRNSKKLLWYSWVASYAAWFPSPAWPLVLSVLSMPLSPCIASAGSGKNLSP